MRKFFNTLLAGALAVSVMLPGIPVRAEGEQQVATEEKKTESRYELINQDFEESADGLQTVGSGFSRKMSPNETNAFAIDNSCGANNFIGSYAQKGLPEGRYHISFDYYAEALTDWYVLLHDGNSEGLTDTRSWYFIRSTGEYFRVSRSKKTWETGYPDYQDRKAKEWYHVNIWIDTENRELIYQLNGKTVVSQKLDDGTLQGFKGFAVFGTFGAAEKSYTYFDNMKFYKEDEEICIEQNPIYIDYALPDGVKANNFTKDHPVQFHLTLKNRVTSAQDAEISYEIRDYLTDETVWESTEPEHVQLPAGETAALTVQAGKVCYGRFQYLIKTRIGERTYTKAIPYTMSNHTEDMPLNYASGVSAHMPFKGNPEIGIPLLKTAGIGSLRGELPGWSTIEPEKGKYVWPDSVERFLQLVDENEIHYMFIVDTGNGWAYPDPNNDNPWNPPGTDEGIAGMGNFLTYLAKMAKGRIYAVENWNEYHNASMAGVYATDYKLNARLHKTIYEGLKAGDPNILVVGIDEDGWGLYNTAAIESYLKFMDKEYFDVISLHPYPEAYVKPEKGITKKFSDDMRTALKNRNFKSDVPIWFSEIGFSDGAAFNDRNKQAAWTVRNYALCMEEQSAEVVFNYNYIQYSTIADSSIYNDAVFREASFGILEDFMPSATEVCLLGKPSYVAVAYYNGIVADCQSMKELYPGNDDKFCYQIKTRNGEDVLMLGAENEETQSFAFDLGCDSVIVGDKFGNEKTVYGINGKFSFAAAEDEIIYVRGNFQNVAECEPEFSLSEVSLEVPVSYNFSVELNTPKDFSGNIQLSAKNIDCLNADDQKISNGSKKLNFLTKDTLQDQAWIQLSVTDEQGRVYYEVTADVSYTKSAKISEEKRWRMSGKQFDLWDLKFDVTNIRKDIPIGGSLVAKENGRAYAIPEIAPGETREVVIPKTKINTISDLGVFDGDLKLSTGETMEVVVDSGLLVAQYAEKSPTIDGVIDKGEYGSEKLKFVIDQKSQVYGTPTAWNGKDDLSAEGYINYDEENVYLAMRVKDNVFRQINEPDTMWNGDSLQVLFVFDKEKTGSQYCISIPKGQEKAAIYRHMQEDNNGGLNGGTATGIYTDAEAAVKNEHGYTTYEIRFDFDKLRWHYDDTKDQPVPGSIMWFSVCINDDDGENRKLWMEYGRKGSAIGSGTNTGMFASEMLFLPR